MASKFNKPSKHVQKFLFSATLTENPEKIAALELFNPLLFLTQVSHSSSSNSVVVGDDVEKGSGDAVIDQDEGKSNPLNSLGVDHSFNLILWLG